MRHILNNVFLQGLYIRFRDKSANTHNYNIITVLNPSTESHIVTNLKKYTKYEFFLSPFYQNLEGQPSNSKLVQTYEDGEYYRVGRFFRNVSGIQDDFFGLAKVKKILIFIDGN